MTLSAKASLKRPAMNSSIFNEIDLRKVFPFSPQARQFTQSVKDRCINPDHEDLKGSMLVFNNGCYCMACGFRLSTRKALEHLRPEMDNKQLVDWLRSGNFKFTPSKENAPKILDADTTIFNHIRLAQSKTYVALVSDFGFTKQSIAKWRLGIADVSVNVSRVDENPKYETQERIAIPVIVEGRVQQIIYRKLYDSQLGEKIQVVRGCGAKLINSDALEKSKRAFHVEGWGDVIALDQLGIVATSSTNGAGHFHSAWIEHFRYVSDLGVSGDADASGHKLITRFQQKLPWAKPVYPPYQMGSKGDWRDFVRDGGTREQFEKLVKQAQKKAQLARMEAKYAARN